MGNIFHLFHDVLCDYAAHDFDYDRVVLDLVKDYILFLVLVLVLENIVLALALVHIMMIVLAHIVVVFGFVMFIYGYTLMIAPVHKVVVYMLLLEEVI
jgi:hypothetical protein